MSHDYCVGLKCGEEGFRALAERSLDLFGKFEDLACAKRGYFNSECIWDPKEFGSEGLVGFVSAECLPLF